ncbi:hypothetical protein CCUS01_03359 [Colletotrichum cuscutae]|uniref:Uncharacterized protein n=1 Tax=Colletotrichum cuscutae TaxID=1209917 RepID=A0AAI9VH42_9PEZI|nr:hypothetical protein CCUS01_03359 [Colletotrichum cuscutae]
MVRGLGPIGTFLHITCLDASFVSKVDFDPAKLHHFLAILSFLEEETTQSSREGQRLFSISKFSQMRFATPHKQQTPRSRPADGPSRNSPQLTNVSPLGYNVSSAQCNRLLGRHHPGDLTLGDQPHIPSISNWRCGVISLGFGGKTPTTTPTATADRDDGVKMDKSFRYEHVETWHSMVANEVPGVATEDAQLIKQVERLLACIRSSIVQLYVLLSSLGLFTNIMTDRRTI